MKLTSTLIVLAFAAVLGGCSAEAPEPEEPAVPEGLDNGSFTASLNGYQIHYEVHGQGPVLMAVTNSWGVSNRALPRNKSRGIWTESFRRRPVQA